MKPVTFLMGLMILPLALMTGGCEPEGFQVSKVEGTVTLDGSPLNGALVIFMPDPVDGNSVVGPFSSGTTDQNGRFMLTTRYGDPGAVIGPHSVNIEYDDIEPLAIQEALSAQQDTGKVESQLDDIRIPNDTDTTASQDDDIEPSDEGRQMVDSDPGNGRTSGWLKQKLKGRRLIPPRYSLDSNLRFTVPRDGTQSAHFDLYTEELAHDNQIEMGR